MPRLISTLMCIGVLLVAAGCGGAETASPLAPGKEVYANTCSACHGSTGQGGVGPSLSAVTETFPSCDDHIEWVTLGSEEWKKVHGDTYGTTRKPIEQVMPGQGSILTPEQIASVVAFERVIYGGADEPATLDDCGVSTTAPTD